MYGNINNNRMNNSATKMTQCTKEQQNIAFPIFSIYTQFIWKPIRYTFDGRRKRRSKKQSENGEFLVLRQTNRKISTMENTHRKSIFAFATVIPVFAFTFDSDFSLNEINNDSFGSHEFEVADGKLVRNGQMSFTVA